MKKLARLISIALCVACGTAAVGGCSQAKAEFYEEIFSNPLADRDVGGTDSLTLQESDNRYTLENGDVRMVLSKENGSICQYVNKQSKVYLVEDAQTAAPLRVCRQDGTDSAAFAAFDCQIQNDDAETKALALSWTLEDGTIIRAGVSLRADAQETVFRLSVENIDLSNPIVSVEYPIFEQVDTLYEPQQDYFVSPVVTGVLFRDPVSNFNSGTFAGIDKDTGMYPSGWNVPMQFQGYYSKGIGGFIFWTRDGTDGIKSFTCTGKESGLRMSIHHFLDDIGQSAYSFDYDIVVGNLVKGTWQECAEVYKSWATQQSWCEKGYAKDRTDLNKQLYENTALVNFGFPYTGKLSIAEQTALYTLMKEHVGGGFLNILFSQSDYAVDLTKQNQDLLTFFEFNTFSTLDQTEFRDNIIRSVDGSRARYGTLVNGVEYYYQCPASSLWRENRLGVEQDYYTDFAVDGFYHDVGIAAVHPLQCFDTSHAHGTRVNILSDAIQQVAEAKQYAVETGIHSVGQELIFEQLLPYVDYYQARAGGSVTSWMEHDRFMPVLENGSAEIIPLFNYVYGQYGALRMDGYLSADVLLGDGYYALAAGVALNGGLVEYNYEFLNQNEYLRAEELDLARLDFIGELGQARLTYGKEYLVYGAMVKAPEIGTGQSTYSYFNKNYQDGVGKSGQLTVDDVVVTAFESEGKIAVFLCNTTGESIEARFILNTLRDYGIDSAAVTLRSASSEDSQMAAVEDGKAKIQLDLEPRKVYMLEIVP